MTTVGTSSPLTATVVGIQGQPVSSMTPHTTDALIFNGSQWVPSLGVGRFMTIVSDGAANPFVFGYSNQPALTGSRTLTAASATETAFDTYSSTAVGSLQRNGGCDNWPGWQWERLVLLRANISVWL